MTTLVSFTFTLSLLGATAALGAGCGSASTPDGTTSTGTDGAGGSGSSTGAGGATASATCTVDLPCPNKGTCALPQGACSPTDKGTCLDVFSCDGPPSGPVCGCDGKVVEGESASCSFLAAGKPYAFAGGCQIGTFACGPLTCNRNAEVCQNTLKGTSGANYECVALETLKDSTCLNGIPDCSCINLAPLLPPGAMGSCFADADHQETIKITVP
jgi:hypothetical protein